MLSDISANGESPQAIQGAIAQYQQDEGASGTSTPNVDTALSNVLGSLNDGTYSQQGSQGAIMGAVSQDGMSGVNSVSIAGQAGGAAQAAGEFDAGSNAQGSLGANTAILESEVANGNPKGGEQIANNANALATEATNAGNTGLATAAQNIAISVGDGSYSGSASLAALQNALPDSSNTLAANNSATPQAA